MRLKKKLIWDVQIISKITSLNILFAVKLLSECWPQLFFFRMILHHRHGTNLLQHITYSLYFGTFNKRVELWNKPLINPPVETAESVQSQTPGQDLQVKPCRETMRKRGGVGGAGGGLGERNSTYLLWQQVLFCISISWLKSQARRRKKKQAQVETNVYADQITGNRVKK